MDDRIGTVKSFYETSYAKSGFNAQRRYPNEEACRFMGRHFFKIPPEERSEIKILETGCGSGANLWMIAKEGFDTYGIDLSQESLNLCQKMLQKYETHAHLSLQDMSHMNFEANTFDAVIDVFSSYCLDKEQGEAYLHNVFKILKPRGQFFSYFPSKGSEAYQHHDPAQLLDEDTLDSVLRKDSPYVGQLYPFRFLHPDQYKENLENIGFRVPYLETVNRTYHSRKETFEFVTIEAQKPATKAKA